MFKFTPQDLRRYQTSSEKVLWGYLRAKRMLGLKFRRQHPIGPFIADFACLSHNIVIEVDGPSHEHRRDYDRLRDQWLSTQKFFVVRITNQELQENRESTLLKIREILLKKIMK